MRRGIHTGLWGRNNLLAAKLRGGALYIAILISIILGIILCMFILMARYNQHNVSVFAQSVQLGYNLQSAFQMARSAYFSEADNNRWIRNTGNDDSIKVSRRTWGAYLLISAQTRNRHQSLAQSGLYGTCMSADTGLVVADNSRPVGISGAVVFKANCYLPKAGIKPAYIEGQSYQGSAQNGSYIKGAPQSIAAPESGIAAALERARDGFDPYNDSLGAGLPSVLNHSFLHKTLVLEPGQPRLSNLSLKNNIKLVCKEIVIDSSCHLDNILIICSKVRFGQGFKGRVHVIARDSIIASPGCRFNYPSSFVLLPNEEESTALRYIQLNDDCIFYGGILALAKGSSGSAQVLVKLHAGSEVNGFVYSSGFMHVEGRVNANAICNKLLLKTPSAVYENHLLACEINPKKYAHLLAVPLLFKSRAPLLRCQKLD